MKKLISLVALLVPSVALAQVNIAPITDINGVSTTLVSIGNMVIYLLMALAVIFIVWNIVMFMIKASDPEGRKGASTNVLWGIVGLVIIISIWGLVNIFTNTFRTNNQQQNPILINGAPKIGANGAQ